MQLLSFQKFEVILFPLQQNEQKDRLGIMVASHNEDTVRYAIQLMKEHGIGPGDKVVCFGQLLGMCDHITFPLGEYIVRQVSLLQSCLVVGSR